MPEYRSPLGEKGMHAFLLAFRRERRLEQAPLMQHAFGQRRFERAIHGLLGQANRGQVVAGDGVGGFKRGLQQIGRRHHAGDEAGGLGLLSADARGVFRSSAMLCFARLKHMKYADSLAPSCSMNGPKARVSSPVPSFSILITRAPRSASTIVQ
jgi:hypothetical protein